MKRWIWYTFGRHPFMGDRFFARPQPAKNNNIDETEAIYLFMLQARYALIIYILCIYLSLVIYLTTNGAKIWIRKWELYLQDDSDRCKVSILNTVRKKDNIIYHSTVYSNKTVMVLYYEIFLNVMNWSEK